jgi:oxygen-dependent protoporphyrinogen oxidase
MLAPVLQGIYASPPDRLSALAIFGPGRRTRGKLVAPAAGMGELMAQLHARLVNRGVAFGFGSPVDRVDPSIPTVICTSAPVAARLLAPHAPRLAAAIAGIRMVSLMPVTAFFEPHPDDVRGFGVLFPRGPVDALGVLFNADIFAGRSTLRSETWIYGDLSADALPRGDAAVRARVAADRLAFSGRADSPVAVHALTAPAELPVYDAAVLAAQAERHGLPPSIALAGNYLGRLGVAALLEEAADAAHRMA